jgi:hypothetical protein
MIAVLKIGPLSRGYGFLEGREVAEMNGAAGIDLRPPARSFLNEVHPSMAGRAVAPGAAVALVLRVRDDAKVGAPIVVDVVVDVIDLLAGLGSSD